MINFDLFLKDYSVAKRRRIATPYNFLPYFFIDGIKYQVPPESNTWDTWITTRHNTQNFCIIDNFILMDKIREDQAIYDPVKGSYVLATDTIVPYKNYSINYNNNGLFVEQIQEIPWLLLRNQNAIAQNDALPYDASYAIVLDKNYGSGVLDENEFTPDPNINSPTNVINSYNINTTTFSLRAPKKSYKLIMPSYFEKIGNNACKGMKGVTNIRLPANLKTIGLQAFALCPDLQQFSISEENQYYTTHDGILYSKDMTTLIRCPEGYLATKLIVPESVTHIEQQAFYGCQNLEEVILPRVTHIGSRAFMNCSNLSNISIPDTIERVGADAFEDCPYLIFREDLQDVDTGASVLYLGNTTHPYRILVKVTGDLVSSFYYAIRPETRVICPYAFHKWRNTLQKVMFLQDVENECVAIEERAFYELSQLSGTFYIPASVRYIGYNAFAVLPNITEVNMDTDVTLDNNGKLEFKGVEIIDIYAFDYCMALKQVNFPPSIREIGEGAFRGCDALEYNIDQTGNGRYWGGSHSNYLILCGANNPTAAITGHKDLRAIYPSALENTEITWLDLRGKTEDYTAIDSIYDNFNYLKIIPSGFLRNNNRITGVVLPNSVEIIDGEAFAHCVNLGMIQIGPNLKKIGQNAFRNCQSLETVQLNEKLDKTQTYKSWFNIEFANLEANPLHLGANLKQKFYGQHTNGDYYIQIKTYATLNIGENVEEIKDYAFSGFKDLTYVNLANASNLKRIGKKAFSNCKRLSGNIIIPSSIEFIDGDPFAETQIKKFENHSHNYAYEPESGTLFDIHWFNQIHSVSHSITDIKLFSYGIDANGNYIGQIRLPIAFPMPGGLANINLGTAASINFNFGKDQWMYEAGDGITDITFLDVDNAYFSLGLGGWASMTSSSLGGGLLSLLGFVMDGSELQDIIKLAHKIWTNIWKPIQYQVLRGIGHFEGAGAYLLGLQNNFYVNKNVTEIADNTFGSDHSAEIIYYGSEAEWKHIKINSGNSWKSIRFLNR